jgi:hypothetical protein
VKPRRPWKLMRILVIGLNMLTKRNWISVGIVVVLLGGVLIFSACSEQIQPPPTPPSPTLSSVSIPISIKLGMTKAPKLDETAELTWTIRAVWDMRNCEGRVELPQGAIKVAGDLVWSGALKRDVPVQLSATIKFVKEGEWAIRGVAKSIIDEKNSWSDVDYLFLKVTRYSGQFVTPGKDREVGTEH